MSHVAHLLLLYFLTELVACLSPGPAVFTVVSQALAGSRAGAIGSILGIEVGNLCWYALAGAGLTALEAALPGLFVALRWAGIAYLLWTGITHLRAAGQSAHWEAAGQRSSLRRGLLSATAVQLSNPKALLFFTVLLPPFIDPAKAMLPQIVALAAIGLSVEAAVLAMYAALALRLGSLARARGTTKAVDRVSGGLLIATATGLAAATLGRA